MTLQKYTAGLSKNKQFKLAIRLARSAIPIWDNYADKNDLSYIDSVAALAHSVDRKLLKDTIDAAEKYQSSNKLKRFISRKAKLLELYKRFEDPVIALQDNDWELPKDVRKFFYAVYNLIEALIDEKNTVFGEPTIYVSINQAIDALETSKTLTRDEINSIMDEIKNGK